MGRHSRKGPAPAPSRPAPEPEPAVHPGYGEDFPYEEYRPYGEDPFPAERRTYGEDPSRAEHRPYGETSAYAEHRPYGQQPPYGARPAYGEPAGRHHAEPTVTHQGYAPPQWPEPDARLAGHPEQPEPGDAWGGRPGPAAWGRPAGADPGRGAVPRPRSASAATLDTDTPAFGTPAVGFPQVTLPARAPAPELRTPPAAADPLTSTGSHRRVPGPRTPQAPAAPEEAPAAEPPGPGRGRKARTYTGMAAVAVSTVLAVVVAVHMASEGQSGASATRSAGQVPDRAQPGQSAASRSDGRPTPQPPAAAAPELSYEQKMAQQFPIDEKLQGPGVFDTVPGLAPAPGKGKKIRYRVDVEQGLGLDPQLFAEAVHRTLNDDRSWGHGGVKTFERVPGGEADFVITLASPGTTGVWCAKSGLDTTVDNVSCDSASTDRVMINAFRWAQGSTTYGAEQMFAYRQMLINHEVGHRLGHGHVNCQTPGALAPIMQQQTKSLDIGGIQCKPNPWVFPGS
ncbi:DUF3152 domain-containing protein [Streptomyces sp. NPDC006326]|uniref:DUF3152 domain-containing protein n=1 Tax=Streptomyces sp. NPDC006326 TaxID=3156752 RepID=UPI0033B679FE